MSKINATYSSGYYIAPDVDFRKLEEQQRQEQRGKRKHDGTEGSDDNVKRQTFAIPFDIICEHCSRRIARGSHVYTNRRATDQRYLDSIRIWELEIRCQFCKEKYYLRTDPETPKDTGGYICQKGCRRVEGDFFALNKQNQAAREEWERAKAEAELNPLAALEKENEAARELEERNRQIEEAVEQRAGRDDRDLISMLRSRPRRAEARAGALDDGEEEEGDEGRTGAQETRQDIASAPTGLPPGNAFSLGDKTGDEGGSGSDGDVADDADERAFREFNADMERRWRVLERQQRAQQRRQEEAQQGTAAEAGTSVDEAELQRVLARYGGERRGKAEPVVSAVAADASTPQPPSAGSSAAQPPSAAVAAPALLGESNGERGALKNKFFVPSDGDDDVNDDVVHVPMVAAAPLPTPQGARLAMRPVTGSVTSRFAAPAPSAARQGGSALLRRLVDDDDDDD